MSQPEIASSKKTIHNLDSPHHFMRVKPVSCTVRIRRGGKLIAESQNALRVTEVATDVLDPVFYLPENDIQTRLKRVKGKTSHCPLKGDASYYSLDGEEPIAWSYDKPYGFSEVLKGRIAFYPEEVIIEEIGKKA